MKLLASLVAAGALALSALVAIPTAATAAYPGTVATTCSYSTPGSVRKNRAYNVGFSVRAAGNARPSGTVSFRVYRVNRHSMDLIRTFSNGYTGPATRHRSLGSFNMKGDYASQMVFRPNNGSVYKSCASGVRSFRVTR